MAQAEYKLNDLLSDLGENLVSAPDGLGFVVSGVTSDSRLVKPGWVFVAVRGVEVDGHDFIPNAVSAGAVAVVAQVDANTPKLGVPLIRVRDTREALVALLKRFLGEPPQRLFAVTGTNGKTTVAHILWRIFTEAGEKAGVVGTLGYRVSGGEYQRLPITTPGPETLWRVLAQMRREGVVSVAMEASSHGLHQKRTVGLAFEAAVFTNLSQDHLDYHGDMASYLEAKCSLFAGLPKGAVSVVNLDDPCADDVIAASSADVVTYALDTVAADVVAEPERVEISGSRFRIRSPWGTFSAETKLPGRFNVYNAVAAFAAAAARGYDPCVALEAIRKFRGVRGRFEIVDLGQPFFVVVDYAHTPEALRNLIETARELVSGRVIVVFGAGGDRDHQKRPQMGEIATRLADVVVITSDNPRSEDPERIIDMIESGAVRNNYRRIVDRRQAIFEAVGLAREGDIVLIAGKGHEDYQIFADRTVHFDDVEVAREAIERRLGRRS